MEAAVRAAVVLAVTAEPTLAAREAVLAAQEAVVVAVVVPHMEQANMHLKAVVQLEQEEVAEQDQNSHS
ncbi:unnamed protein product [Toxocara canis]|uniref:Secreted protein n=1 Tax=Toxocara canis TaxID=6265 RepID=A0A183U9Y3_TOXCA|nr:unnamed protein product [Toxocara canis]